MGVKVFSNGNAFFCPKNCIDAGHLSEKCLRQMLENNKPVANENKKYLAF